MIKKIKNFFLGTYYKLISSIAFLPSVISLGFFFLAFISLGVFDSDFNIMVNEKLPFLIIDNADTSRSVLSAFIGGIISLTSISFSMVMLLLSQASANFSPRLLPGLISDRRNQIILGLYLGTIIFMVIVLISIIPSDGQSTTSGMSVLLSIIFGMSCLAAFVYFIHVMSQSIQIDKILSIVYKQSKSRLQDRIDEVRSHISLRIDYQHVITSGKSGYYQGINRNGLLEWMKDNEVNVKLVPFKGQFMNPYSDLARTDIELTEDQQKDLLSYMMFSNNHQASENYVLGIKQVTEVGVKAMSPGINDPGTAIVSINYLTHLLELRMQLDDHEVYRTSEDKFGLEFTVLDFETIVYESFAEYRAYCKHDYMVMRKLIEMFVYLLDCEMKVENYRKVLLDQLELLKTDIRNSISNEKDLERLLSYLPSEFRS